MSRYASNTSVSSEKSRMEIEKTLSRYGATGFMYAMRGAEALIAFEKKGRSIRFKLPLPDPESVEFTRHSRGKRDPEAARRLWEQACRQRWRALLLCIKAKLEAVECGITTFEHEFLAHFLTHDGLTVGDHIIPTLGSHTIPMLMTGKTA